MLRHFLNLPKNRLRSPLGKEEAALEPIDVLTSALEHYVVRRGDLKTVIAGYPWFLDWGRDALIFTRGLIAAVKSTMPAPSLNYLLNMKKTAPCPI
jgi:glycogen debranching enzyme